MNVKELIDYLGNFPDDCQVGRLGYFGEFHPMALSNFKLNQATVGWTFQPLIASNRPVDILTIEPPDIGPEPD